MELISALSVETILEFQVIRRLISVKTTSKARDNAALFVRRELKAGNFEMTTPDKEEMPTDIRTGGNFWAEKRDGRWQLLMRHRGPSSSFCVAQINHWADNSEALTTRIANAYNAYEPMREALAAARDAIASLDKPALGYESAGDGSAYWPVQSVLLNQIDAALSTLPVNDRHHSGSDSYQADAGAPALSEKVNVRSEWRPIESAPADGTEILAYMPGLALGQIVLYWQDGYWRKKANSMGLKYPPTHWMPLPSPPGAELNFSNEPESDAGSLKSDTSSQPASEAGKLSTDTGEVL